MGGVELSRTALGDLRRRVAYVPQEVHLLGGTLLDNLALFREQVAEEDVRCAVASVGLGDWLDSRPEGLGTWLRAGDDLSAGEAQLLALARVFLQSPGLVVLDEPTARLDLFSQRRLERALDRLLERRTGVIVAHRLETVDRATHVLVLEKGRVAEYGLRSQLIGDPRSQFARLRRGGLIEVLA
jgi:ATP-binding cassette subfamily B protein